MALIAQGADRNAARWAQQRDQTWREFAAGIGTPAGLLSWLTLLCAEQIPASRHAGIWLRRSPAGGPTAADAEPLLEQVAAWPPSGLALAEQSAWNERLRAAAQSALRARQGIMQRHDLQGALLPEEAPAAVLSRALLAYPFEAEGIMAGVVALELDHPNDSDLVEAWRRIHWASPWLARHCAAGCEADEAAAKHAAHELLDLCASLLQQTGFQETAFFLVNALADRFGAAHAAMAMRSGSRLKLCAISRMAWFEPGSPWVKALEAAMEEVRHARESVIWPGRHSAIAWPALNDLQQFAPGHGWLLTPLERHGFIGAVLAVERQAPFTEAERDWLEALGALASGILETAQRADRGLPRHCREAAWQSWRKLAGPGHYTWKWAAATLGMLILAASLWRMPYQVVAGTVIEGERQRVVSAPFDGFVARADVRAGDIVQAGQLMAQLDERDLLLERERWHGEREQSLRKLREAESRRALPETQVLAAQLSQAEAQLAWVEAKIAKASIRAPFAAVVVSGDLSQTLGAPVETGKTLFEVAPLNAYRVVLKVDERDIAHVQAGQRGELRLMGLPGKPLPMRVARVTPVATPQEGQNYFRVEAQLDRPSPDLRPGMEGIGRIMTAPRPLLWIWTHGFTEWLRLQVWRYWP